MAAGIVSAGPSIPQSGWTLLVRRRRTERRDTKSFARTVGEYQVYVDGAPVADLRGMTVEREGPGDNGPVGKADHRCIEAGTYPLRSHNTENYTTIGFATDGDHPRPALEVGDTAARVGILVHPASGYGSTIGCINLAGSLDDADSDFSLSDSTARVVAVINDLKRHNGGTLPHDGAIGDCRLIVVDASIDQLGRQALRLGSRGPLVRDWQAFLAVQGFNIGAGGADGSFGAATREATLAFQNAHGLAADGAVGPGTIAAARQLGFGAPAPSRAVARAPAPAFDAAVAATIRMAAAGGGLPAFDAPSPAMSAGVAAVTMAVPIRALRIGATGPLVKAWQSFLRGQDFDPGGTDGHFGDNTLAATMAFQTAHGLKADGVAGQQTFNAAIALGFQLIEEPDTDNTGSNFPPRPNFASLQSTRQRWALFGRFDYVPAPVHGNPERIRILGSWVADNLVDVPIPQLARTGISSAPATIRFHRLASAQLQALWAAWESANLLGLILTYDGSFVPRFKRGQANGGDEALSNHSFGSAFDINEPFNKFGSMPALVGQRGSVRKLVPIANEHGFYWGGHFGNPDGMHFEVAFLTP
jgi:peptidoglycan hydrolase-like protein with peptidoglycan-binding domain